MNIELPTQAISVHGSGLTKYSQLVHSSERGVSHVRRQSSRRQDPFNAGRSQRAPSTASAQYFDLLEKGLSSSPLPAADQAKQFCGLMQRNVTATFDLGDKLIQAKDMQEATRIQSEFFQDQMRSLTDHARSMASLP